MPLPKPISFALLFAVLSTHAFAVDLDRDPAWAEAYKQPAMDATETRAFMKMLAQYVFEHHMKRAEGSPQRGMIYEYYREARAGQFDQHVQGEALDTMHDGSWFALAMVNAYRATDDAFYKEMLTQWQLPFYLKMLNHSDELFEAGRNDARPEDKSWQESKEWLLQGREKGFVPYWWDNGASVNKDLLGRRDPDEHLSYPGHNEFAGKPNPQKLLSGYSYGSSNHMAQDLALMLQQTWLLFHGSKDAAETKLAGEIAAAAQHLQECRARHGSANIPAVQAALAVTSGDATVRQKLPDVSWKSLATARSDYRRAFFDYKPDEQISVPAFADNQEYQYYVAIARDGGLSEPLAFSLTYDAYTLPKLYQAYSDDSPVPPGIGVFDLYPYKFVNGKPIDYRSQRKGPSNRPKPIGSRFGPQNMVVSGWALQALKAYPGLWENAKTKLTAPNYFPAASEEEVRAALERELGGGLRTWQAIFNAKGHIPTGIGTGSSGAGYPWDELSDTGGYAHLISAAAEWVNYLEGKRDWELHGLSK